MNIVQRNVLAAVAVFLVAGIAVWFSHQLMSLRISFAEEQVSVFCRMAENVDRRDESELKERLTYLRSYYPSGTKQVTGSPLDRLVEAVRSHCIADIERELDSRQATVLSR